MLNISFCVCTRNGEGEGEGAEDMNSFGTRKSVMMTGSSTETVMDDLLAVPEGELCLFMEIVF